MVKSCNTSISRATTKKGICLSQEKGQNGRFRCTQETQIAMPHAYDSRHCCCCPISGRKQHRHNEYYHLARCTRTSLAAWLNQSALLSQPSCEGKGSLSVRRNHRASIRLPLRSVHETQPDSLIASVAFIVSVRREDTETEEALIFHQLPRTPSSRKSPTQSTRTARYTPSMPCKRVCSPRPLCITLAAWLHCLHPSQSRVQ